jgi:cystathionine beta-lyase/cystathionine gamma-synthase
MTHQHPSRMGHPRASVTSPSAPPIYQTTAFDVPDLDVLHALYEGKASGDVYTRDSNPNHTALAESIAIMEDAEAGAVFASGMGAAGSIFLVSGMPLEITSFSRELFMERRCSSRLACSNSLGCRFLTSMQISLSS